VLESLNTVKKRVTVRHGEFAVTDDPHVCMSSVLGSCVATVLWDPVARVGGMNHILLPGVSDYSEVHLETLLAQSASPMANSQRVHAMEVLINAVLKAGGARSRLQAKVFGGAGVVPGLSNVGQQNISFVDQFLATEGIVVMARSVGGNLGRRLEAWPTSGRARQKLVSDCSIELDEKLAACASKTGCIGVAVPSSERQSPQPSEQGSGDLDLF